MNDDFDAWAAALSPAGRKVHIDACLDEFEVVLENASRGKSHDQDKVKAMRAWGERQKRMLRALGHRRRMPVIGSGVPFVDVGIFGEAGDEVGQEGNKG